MKELHFMIAVRNEKNLEVMVDGAVKMAKTGNSRASGSIKLCVPSLIGGCEIYKFKDSIPINDPDEAFEWYKNLTQHIQNGNYKIASPPEGGLVMIFPKIRDRRHSNSYGYVMGIQNYNGDIKWQD